MAEDTIKRTARLEPGVAAMLARYAADKHWSNNTALNQALKEYLSSLGYGGDGEA